MPTMASDIDEDIMEKDDGPGLADEEPDDVTNMCPFGLNDTELVVMDDLGLHEMVSATAEKSSDVVEEQADEDIMGHNAGLSLGEWFNLPRQSRRIAGIESVDPLDDPNDIEGMSVFHVATNNVSGNFSRFDDGLKNGMLKEAV